MAEPETEQSKRAKQFADILGGMSVTIDPLEQTGAKPKEQLPSGLAKIEQGNFVDINKNIVGLSKKESILLQFEALEEKFGTEAITKVKVDMLKNLPMHMKQIILDRQLEKSFKIQADIDALKPISAAVRGERLIKDIKNIALGIGQFSGAIASDIYSNISGQRGFQGALNQPSPETEPKTPDEARRQLIRMKLRGDVSIDASGKPFIITPEQRKGTQRARIIKGFQEAFAPHAEAFREIRDGKPEKAFLTMKKYYDEHPLDMLFDASLVLAATGGSLKVGGMVFKGLSKTGSNAISKGVLSAAGDTLLGFSDALDPLMVTLKGANAVRKGLSHTRLGQKIAIMYESRTFANKVFREGTRQTRFALEQMSDELKKMFGDIAIHEKEAFVAIAEGRATILPTAREEFVQMLDGYRQWIGSETEFLIGEKLIKSQTARSVAYQPMMSATTLSMNDLAALAEDIAVLRGEFTQTLKNVERELRAVNTLSPEIAKALAEGKIPRSVPAVDVMEATRLRPQTEAEIAAAVKKGVKQPPTKKQLREDFVKAAEEPAAPVDRPIVADTAAAEQETVLHLSEVDPIAAKRLNDINKDITAADNYLRRLRENIPGTPPTKIPREALIAEAKKIMVEFEERTAAASSSLRPVDPTTGELKFPKEQRTLTVQEIEERSGIPARTLQESTDALTEAGFAHSDARSMIEVVIRHADVESSSVSRFIDDVAERKARATFEGFDALDPQTKAVTIGGFAFEAKEIIKDLRAPIEAGKRPRISRAADSEIASDIFNLLKIGQEMDNLGPGKIGPAFTRAKAYVQRIVEENKLSKNLFKKGETLLKKHNRFNRRASIKGMGVAEKEEAIAQAEWLLNERRLEAKKIRESIEARAKGFQSTYTGEAFVEMDTDAIIMANLEKQMNDTVNVHSYAPGSLERAYLSGGTDITQAQRESMLERASNAGSREARGRLKAIDFTRRALEQTQDEIDRLVKVQGAYRLPPSLQGHSPFLIDMKKFSAMRKKLVVDIEKVIKTKGEAGQLSGELAELQRRRSEFNTAGTRIIKLRRQRTRQKRRLFELRRGGSMKKGDLVPPTVSRGPDTIPPTNVIDDVSKASVSAGERQIPVPTVVKTFVGAAAATPRRIIGALTSAIQADRQIFDALKKVRDFTIGRGIPIVFKQGERFDIQKISALMAEAKIPKDVRIKTREILKTFNDVRPRVVGEINPFIIETLLDKQAVTAADLVRLATGKAAEGKFTVPVYFPHLFEESRNILDAVVPGNATILKQIRDQATRAAERAGTKFEDELLIGMQRQGYTGYYDEAGTFHKVTKGRGPREMIRGVLGRKLDLPIRRPGFLKRRTGAWGYIDSDPERVLRSHKSELIRYMRNRNIVKELKAHPLVKKWDGTREGLLPGYRPMNFDAILSIYEESIDFRKTTMAAIEKTQYAGDEIMKEAVLAHIPKIKRILAVGSNKNGYVQVPKALATSIKHNIFADVPPRWVKYFFDNPTNWWRAMTLASMPRWHFNNFVGNVLMTALNGTSPMSLVRAKLQMFDDVLPDELASTGLVAAEISEGGMRFGTARIFDRFYSWNNSVDVYFKKAAYINNAVKIARKDLVKGAGFKLYRSDKELHTLLADIKVNKPGTRDRIMDSVHEFLFDYMRMDPLERIFLRRAMPFWSWYKNINRVAYLLPLKHPKRAWVLEKIGRIGHEAVNQSFDEIGIEFEDLPRYMQGRIILDADITKPTSGPGDPDITTINTRAANPFADVLNVPEFAAGGVGVQSRLPGVHPAMALAAERLTGTSLLTGKKFSDPETFNAFDGSSTYIDPDTGEQVKNVRPSPPILEHIMRQTAVWGFIKDLSYVIRGHTLGAQYGTNTIIDPKWIIDPLTGEPRYPRTVMTDALRTVGLTASWIQDLGEFQRRLQTHDTTVQGQRFNRLIANDPDFKDFAITELEKVSKKGLSREELLQMFKTTFKKVPRKR